MKKNKGKLVVFRSDVRLRFRTSSYFRPENSNLPIVKNDYSASSEVDLPLVITSTSTPDELASALLDLDEDFLTH